MAKNDYFYITSASSEGTLAISKRVFYDITLNSIKRIKGVRPNQYSAKKKKKENKYFPISCSINKDNKINIEVDVSVKKGIDVKATCLKLKEEIESQILLMCETAPVNININVANIEL